MAPLFARFTITLCYSVFKALKLRMSAIRKRKVRRATIYIVNEGSHTVSVIDPSTNTVVDTVRVGFGPVQAVSRRRVLLRQRPPVGSNHIWRSLTLRLRLGFR